MPATWAQPRKRKQVATDKSAANRITTKAFRALREKYPDDWEAMKEAAAAELGVEYKRRKTKEEKAHEELAKLLSENPGLRAELFAEIERSIVAGGAAPARENEQDVNN